MIATVLSVNAGRLAPVPGLTRPSGIHKTPVGRIEVRDPGPKRGGLGSGVVGDAIGSSKHHGGETQAVYAVAREELDRWGSELGRDLPDGMFGENLTTSGLDVDAAEVGEQWRVGTALLEVCGPRVPCATFAKHMGEQRWVRRFTEHGRTGAYLAVREAGVSRDRRPGRGRPPTGPRADGADVLPGVHGRQRPGRRLPRGTRAARGRARVARVASLSPAPDQW